MKIITKKDNGVKGAKAGPTIQNAKKLNSKGGTQLFPTPTFNFNAPAAKKFSNTPAIDNFTNQAFYGEQNRKMAENSPNVRFAKQKQKDEAYRNYVKKNPLKAKATGQVDMTMSPVDLAVGAGAGLVGSTARLATSALGATVPGTGLTVGQGLNAYGAYDAIANRAPAVVRDIKNENYGSALGEAGMGALGMSGIKNTGLNDKLLKPVANYGKDFYQASKASGRLKLPTYENLYRWQPDYYPEGLLKSGEELTDAQKALTGSWFTRRLDAIPFYSRTRSAPGNLKTFRTSTLNAENLEKNMPDVAKGMSGQSTATATSNFSEPGEVILSKADAAKAKNIRFDENPSVKASAQPEYQELEKGNYGDSYKRSGLEHFTLPYLKKAIEPLNKPILGIDRKYFPFKKGSKDVKPVLKYKDGSKGVSLAFSRGEKDPKGGLTQKGVDKYNRATGGNLKMAVTTPPSKLKAGSKDANRRKSFCARMSGVKGPMEKNGKPTRKALALRKWNC